MLGEANLPELNSGLVGVVRQAVATKKEVIIDLRGVQLMTSSVIGQFLMANRMTKEASIDLRLANVGEELRDALRSIRLLNTFRFCDDDSTGESNAISA